MGSTLDYYYNKSKIWLPMKAENHDPSNTTGVELLVDGDMEAAGVAAWTVGSSAILTKSTVNPYEGTQALRVTEGGVAAPFAAQSVLIPGTTSRLIGRIRGDGVFTPILYDLGTGTIFTGTASTDWQEVDIEFTVGGSNQLRFYSNATVGSGGWAEFDVFSLEALESRTLDVSGYGNHALLGDGATPGTMPTKSQKRGYTFNGSTDYLMTSYLPTPTGTMAAIFQATSTASSGIMGTFNLSLSRRCYLDVTSGVIRTGIGTTVISGSTPINEEQHYFGAVTWDGSTITLYLDDNTENSAVQAGNVEAGFPVTVGAWNFNNTALTYWNGNLKWATIFDTALNAVQIRDLKSTLFRQVNHV